MKIEIDRDKFVTISELTKLLDSGITSNAVRRNINKYPEYFNSTFVRGVQYVGKESGLKVYKVIDGALRPGRNRGGLDVIDALKKAKIEPISKSESDQPSQSQPVDSKRVVFELCNEDRELIKSLLKSKKGD
jgi:hypothetical protein